ncbi:MAG TPA: AAA family ATPase, partial [Acetobacteraceae bacterium]|nr:AAA family ATPase [Acetobacteraceae bacterium]
AGAPPVETHISYLFLGHDTVWKLKKAVHLPFVDFTRLDDRHRFCQRELALNASAAPGLYRDVVPIVRQSDGSLTVDGAGEVLDWVVRMARVPAGDFLDVKAAASGLPPALLDQIADAVAAWHLSLPPVLGLRPDMAAIARGNVDSAVAAGLVQAEVLAWRDTMLAGLRARAAWSDARAAAGFVRRCHGDLHLGNLCLWQGRPVLFDALEFDEALATIDVAYDLAFLLMDLEHSLDRPAANRVLNRYVARTGDAALVGGLPVFLSMRAMIRAHVEASSGHSDRIAGYLAAAARYLQPHPPLVIAIGGLPGSGKSTLARTIAPGLGLAPGALVLRSDEIRKRQHGAEPEQRLPQSAYTEARSTAVFEELARLVATAAKAGHAVIADATFMDLAHRSLVETAAKQAGVAFLGIWLTAPLAELEQRIAARAGDASDATVEVLRAAVHADPGSGDWHAVDAINQAAAVNEVLTLANCLLRSHIAF